MNFFKRLFGKSGKVASNDDVTVVQNIIPIVDYTSSEDSLFGKLSPAAQKAMLSGFKNLSKEQEKAVFNEIDEACKDSINPNDLNTLALLYFNGTGVKRDVNKGVELLRQAAEQGNAAAMDNIGNYYNSNWGGNDLEAAEKWWRKAAEKGFAASQATLGLMLKERGEYKQAMEWAKKGAAQGNAAADYLMGTFYTHGYGVDVNHDEAIKWYKLAAEKGHARAQADVATCYANGEGVKRDERQMAYWYEKAAAQGDPMGLRGMYLCYLEGTGVAKDQHKAFEYLQRAADTGLALAQHELGNYYLSLDDRKNAQLWFTKAAEQGFARSQSELGIIYLEARNNKNAMYWLEKAAQQGHSGAQNNLAALYMQEKEQSLAVQWWQEAAKNGNIDAMNNLAECYIQGVGVEQNILTAMHYWEKASHLGDEQCAQNLASFKQHMGDKLPAYLLGEAVDSRKINFPVSTSLMPPEFIDNPQLVLQECENGNPEAQVFAASAYEHGAYGFNQDVNECQRWLEEASRNDYSRGHNNLASSILILYKDYNRAIELYYRAAKQGLSAAKYNLGICYAIGMGVKQDMKQAIKWLNKAAASGHEGASRALAIINGKDPDELEDDD